MEGEVKKMYKTRIKTTLLVGLVVLASFIRTGISGAAMAGSEDARAGDSATGKWQTLFDGKLLNTFRGWRSEDMPKGWHVVDATLSKEGNVEDLVTREPFRDFELELEWSIGKAGNSGVFYRGTREYDEIYWSAPEYQLLDDANAPDGRNPLTSAASAYGLYAAPAGVVKPFGEWNKTRILVKGNHVEHWLNDQKVVEYDLGSPEWKAKVAASKFSKYPNYGLAKAGVIGIQGDHPGSLALRHIRIRELP
ncbi:MAG: hypothetical protein QOK23_3304 [Gammaproteobacteria bacterium]|jgi:hypothetical protein|nr:hypothetical protein [Gammaproteobacteria bacterium]